MSDSEDYDSDAHLYTYEKHNLLDAEDSDFDENVEDFPRDDELEGYRNVKRYRCHVDRWECAKAERDWFKKHNIPRRIMDERILILMERVNKESFGKKETWRYHISVTRVNGECAFLIGEKVKNSKELQNVFLIDKWTTGPVFNGRYEMDKTQARQILDWADVDRTKIWAKCLYALLNDWNECRKIFKYY
jgi:hypothetical protein